MSFNSQYIKEGKTTLMIAISCTEACTVPLSGQPSWEYLESKELPVTVRHRDIKK